MRGLISILLLAALVWDASAQLNLTLSGNVRLQQSNLSDVWGYTDALDNEYAIVGLSNGGISIVDVTSPSNLVEVFYEPGPPTGWWDIKTWNNHAYVTNENSGGLMIVDLNPLPNSDPIVSFFSSGGWSSAHNLYIDEKGICYIFGANRGNGGAIMYDLTSDPKAPVEVGVYDVYYAHDGMARGDTLYLANIDDGWFSVLDVSNKSSPVLLATMQTPSNNAHNVWVSDDGDYLYTTDEVANGFIASYDISDLGNITELDRVQSSPGENVIPHNVHFINEYLVTSYYNDGVLIHDASRPHNLVTVGRYDTDPDISGSGFTGSWGVYPWLPSGNILASDVLNGLYVLAPQYVRGCYLEGAVTDANTNVSLNNVVVRILATGEEGLSDLTGNYAAGTALAGTYDVLFRKFGYESDVVEATLSNGNITIVNNSLVPLTPFALTGLTISSEDGSALSSCHVTIKNEDYLEEFITDQDGGFIITNFFPSEYEILVGKWGYETKCFSKRLDETNNRLIVELEEGFYDDFSFDFDWTITGNSSNGDWERGAPIGTFYGPVEVHANGDYSKDCSEGAYTTGNDGNIFNEVDGVTVLTSPMFDATGISDPHVNYFRWFFNFAQSIEQGNDSLLVYLSNGKTVRRIDSVFGTINPATGWIYVSKRITDFMDPTDSMHIKFKVSDRSSQGGHITEGGVDLFELSSGPLSLSAPSRKEVSAKIFPNPTDGPINVSYTLSQPAQIEIFDLYGRRVINAKLKSGKRIYSVEHELLTGIYIVRIVQDSNVLYAGKLVIVR